MRKSFLADALIDKGIRKGFYQGQHQQAIEIAKNLLANGLTPEFVLNTVTNHEFQLNMPF